LRNFINFDALYKKRYCVEFKVRIYSANLSRDRGYIEESSSFKIFLSLMARFHLKTGIFQSWWDWCDRTVMNQDPAHKINPSKVPIIIFLIVQINNLDKGKQEW